MKYYPHTTLIRLRFAISLFASLGAPLLSKLLYINARKKLTSWIRYNRICGYLIKVATYRQTLKNTINKIFFIAFKNLRLQINMLERVTKMFLARKEACLHQRRKRNIIAHASVEIFVQIFNASATSLILQSPILGESKTANPEQGRRNSK